MRFLLSILFFLTFSLFAGCTASKSTPLTISESKVFFGSGGGFTGAVNEYCLLYTGEIFRKQAYSSWIQVKNKDKNLMKQSLYVLKSIDLQGISLNQPGNRYKFIRVDEESNIHEIVWGKEGVSIPKEVEILYNMLNELVKDNQ